MTQEERLELLAGVAGGVARIMGEDTEIVLYDLYKREVVFIANGHVTGREAGYRIDATVYQAIEGLVDEDGCLIGYGSQSAKGGNLRASHMIFRDDEGEPCAMLCFNQDISKYEAMMQYITRIAPNRLEEFKNVVYLGGYPAATKWFRRVFPEYNNQEAMYLGFTPAV
jgi:predicted transcriptional regulator YheO